MSAVKNRIASLEAASKGTSYPSPSRPTYRPRNSSLTPERKPVAVKQEPQPQVEQPLEDTPINQYRRRSKERSQFQRDKIDANVNRKASNANEQTSTSAGPASSTTVTAAESRKSRIRQSQQEVQTSNTPTTNLSDKRRQRRLLQSQRRLKTAAYKAASETPKKEAELDGTGGAGNNRIPESPGEFSTNSNAGRFSKLSRLQRKPNGIDYRQSSAATTATRASVETSVIGNTSKLYGRRHIQESPQNITPMSNYAGGIDQYQLNASLEAPTDDDATLTSVHRIMEGNSKHTRTISENSNQSQNHSYETIMSQRNPSLTGPSWKSNRGTGNKNTIWKEEEKSDKADRVLRTDYSSDYDMDDTSKTDRSRQSANFAEVPVNQNANNTNGNLFPNNVGTNNNRRIDDDDRTFDYGDRDDESNGGTSFRRRREAEQRRARMAASNQNVINKIPHGHSDQGIHQTTSGNNGEPMLLSKSDMEHLAMNESPSLRLSAGVAAVATVGMCVAGGPIGILAGVAAGGLGYGYMQIPEEERKKIEAKAEVAMASLQQKACDASEAMSSSCINTYQDSGVAEQIPQCIPASVADRLVPHCPTGGTKDESVIYSNAGGVTAKSAQAIGTHIRNSNNPEVSTPAPTGPLMEPQPPSSMSHNERVRVKKVACLRNVRILPIAQIHGLEPTSQPRAWLDIVASANTSNDEKNEAMEEILLLAKDKRRAKIFLDEGILDYIIWTISRYIEKVEVIGKNTDWANPNITPSEKTAANLAAMCCVTLGKAHCAAIHTEGDLLLMSMYERGTVPEERQVAQMLHEVPHHARVTKTNDPTIVQPSKEVFAPRELTLSQAEELARSIKLVANGKM